jgi:hypothetical protein
VASITVSNAKQARECYLLNLLVNVPSLDQQVRANFRHAGRSELLPIYVDDFRFHPVTSPTTIYV